MYQGDRSTSLDEVVKLDFEEKKMKLGQESPEGGNEGKGDGDSSTGSEGSGEDTKIRTKGLSWAQKFYDKESDREPAGSRMGGLETVDFSV